MPTTADAINAAISHLQAGRLLEGEAICRQVVGAAPDSATAWDVLADVLRRQGRWQESAECYRRLLALDPRRADALNNLGNILLQLGNVEDAADAFQRALSLRPDLSEIHNGLGLALQHQGRMEEALGCFQRATTIRPDYAQAIYNEGNILFTMQQRLDDAAACFQRALIVRPDLAEVHFNLGLIRYQQGHLEEAATFFDRAVALKPDYRAARWGSAILSLLHGDFERGWREYEARWQTWPRPPRDFSQPVWDGRPLKGQTVLIYAEEGLGDSIQFARYLPLVQERGGNVVFECQPPLVTLLKQLPLAAIVPVGAQLPPFDWQLPMLSLPKVFGTRLDTIPAQVAYLHAEKHLLEKWGRRLSELSGVRVAIAWQGNPSYHRDAIRSIPLDNFALLAGVPNVRLISVQKGPGVEQIPAHREALHLTDFNGELDEAAGPFMDTAAILKNIHLLITSDTAVAHLAGALGTRVWLAAAHVPDWRWLLNREDSPWYPIMRIFRQPRAGDWTSVFQTMRNELASVTIEPSQSDR